MSQSRMKIIGESPHEWPKGVIYGKPYIYLISDTLSLGKKTMEAYWCHAVQKIDTN